MSEIFKLGNGKEEKTTPEMEISPEILRRLKVIAERVGGDFGLKIEIGQAGSGSSFNPLENKITFDPTHIKENSELAEFIAAHEGGHRAITRGPHEIGLKDEKIEEFYSQLGFAFGQNSCEDPADNNWFSNKFEGLREPVKNVYDKQLEQENIPLGLDHPEVKQAIAMLGYIPRFVYFGSEIIRDWHQNKFSSEINPEIKKALEKTREKYQEYFKDIPSSEKTEKETIEKARERFVIFSQDVWPEMKKIVEMDINDEKLRQMAGKMMDDILKNLDKKSKKELKDAMKQGKDAMKKEKEQEEKGNLPLPMDRLSEKLKEKLQEIFDKLTDEQKKELEQKAQDNLEKLEDKLNKEKEGKLNSDKPETHQERRERIETEKREREEKIKEEKELEKSREELKKKIEKEMSEYDKYYQEVKPIIEDLYQELQKVFLPQRHPRWKKGYPSGSRLDLLKAMQFEADKSKYTEIWERKTIPQKIDYKFIILVDMSGSMGEECNYKKIKETFKGLIVLSEVLNRIGIKHEIAGFSGEIGVKIFKDFKEELDKKTRDKISSVLTKTGGGTPTARATEFAFEELGKNKGKDNFLITLTDGQPDSSESLKEIIKEIREKTSQKLVGLGLGENTKFVEEFYPAAKGNIKVEQLPKFLAELLKDMIRNPQKY
jgi:hypothetical protein